MARSFNGSSEYCIATYASAPDYPISYACWAYPTSDTANAYCFGNVGTGLSNISDFLGCQGSNPGDHVNMRCGQGGSTQGVDTTSAFTVNTWTHIAGVVASTTDRKIYQDGANMVQNTNSLGHQAMDKLVLGAFQNQSTRSSWFPGRLMHCGIWLVALTADDIASLAKGFSPLRIRPDKLIFYDRGVGTFINLIHGITSATDNSGGQADHGRSYGF